MAANTTARAHVPRSVRQTDTAQKPWSAAGPATVLLTTVEAALFLTIRPSTLEKWRCTGEGPRFVRMGHVVRYLLADLIAFVQANATEPPSEAWS